MSFHLTPTGLEASGRVHPHVSKTCRKNDHAVTSSFSSSGFPFRDRTSTSRQLQNTKKGQSWDGRLPGKDKCVPARTTALQLWVTLLSVGQALPSQSLTSSASSRGLALKHPQGPETRMQAWRLRNSSKGTCLKGATPVQHQLIATIRECTHKDLLICQQKLEKDSQVKSYFDVTTYSIF